MAKATKTAKTVKTTKKAAKAPKTTQETNLISRVTARPISKSVQSFRPGDTVNVYVKVKEGEKERVQLYKGVVTKLQGKGATRSFTVRKISAGVGVERIFPFTSPALDRVEVVTTGKVRRAKLYYLRGLEGKASKIESELAVAQVADETAAPEVEAKKETPKEAAKA
jgi:large subunit ribosomal protein L19